MPYSSPFIDPFRIAKSWCLNMFSIDVAKDLLPYGIFQSFDYLFRDKLGEIDVCSLVIDAAVLMFKSPVIRIGRLYLS